MKNAFDQIADDIEAQGWPGVYLVSPKTFHRFAMDSNGKIERDAADRYSIRVTNMTDGRECLVTSDATKETP